MRRRRTTHDPLTDRQLADLYESLRSRDDDEMHAVLADYGTDALEAIGARRRLRGAYVPPLTIEGSASHYVIDDDGVIVDD